MFHDKRGFDGVGGGRFFNRTSARSVGQRIKSSVLRREFSGFDIDTFHFDTAPEAAPGKPHLVFIFDRDVAVDRVPVVPAWLGTNHHALIDPLIVRMIRIESLVRNQTHGGVVRAEPGYGVVEMIFVIEIRNIRRPNSSGPSAFAEEG